MRTYEPLNTLKPVAEDLWIVDGPIVRLAMYSASMPFPTRMTVIRLSSGELFLHSPTALEEGLRAELERLGPIRHLVSPNKIHYTNIAAWKAAYPDAVSWASPGVRERAASQGISVTFDRELGDTPEPAWAADLDQLMFRGSRFMDEVVFLHRKSQTLVLADLIENFERSRMSLGQRMLIRLAGSVDPDGKAPLDFRMTFFGHKQQARESLRRMEAWKPQRIILGHGRWYPSGGEQELRRAFRWLEA
jgi:hypothetical protein